jgi:hypothetical protein
MTPGTYNCISTVRIKEDNHVAPTTVERKCRPSTVEDESQGLPYSAQTDGWSNALYLLSKSVPSDFESAGLHFAALKVTR